MDYRYLGRSALKVSPLCLGTMMFGGATDEPTARRIVDKARGQGINFLDTADLYNGGKCEEVVGRCIAEHRHHWVVATKFGYNMQRQAQRGRAIAQVDRPGRRRQPAPARHRLHRHRLLPPLGQPGPVRGTAARDQGPDRARQGALLRRVQLQGLAHRRSVPRRRPARHGPANRQPAALQHRRSPGRGRAASRRRPFRHRRRALQPARARRAQRQVRSRQGRRLRTPAPAATTRASCKPNGARNRSRSPARWPSGPRPRACRPSPSPSPG